MATRAKNLGTFGKALMKQLILETGRQIRNRPYTQLPFLVENAYLWDLRNPWNMETKISFCFQTLGEGDNMFLPVKTSDSVLPLASLKKSVQRTH